MRGYTESTINIIEVLILKVIDVNNLSKLSNIFNTFYKQINFYTKRIVLYEKKTTKTNNTNELIFLKKKVRFEPATSCILRKRSTTCAISDVTIYHLNVIDEHVNVYAFGTNL